MYARQSAERRDRRGRVPFDVGAAGEGIRYRCTTFNGRLFALKVSNETLFQRFHPGGFHRFGLNSQSPDCRGTGPDSRTEPRFDNATCHAQTPAEPRLGNRRMCVWPRDKPAETD
jgi:hypothetical protein